MFSTYFKVSFGLFKNLYTMLSTHFQVWCGGFYKVIHTIINMTTFLRKLLVIFHKENPVDISLAGIYNKDGL